MQDVPFRCVIDVKNNGRPQQALAIDMHISRGFYVEGLLLLLNFSAHPHVLARIEKHASADKNRGLAILPQHPPSQGSYMSHHVSFRPADVMTKRDDEQSDDLWIRRISIMTSSVPIAESARFLDLFYNSILYNALSPWCCQPPQQLLIITFGRLQLTMTVVLDNGVPQGIPWSFVRNFARNMLAMTAGGFTGTYDMYYGRGDAGIPVNPSLPNFGVEVRLRFLWDV